MSVTITESQLAELDRSAERSGLSRPESRLLLAAYRRLQGENERLQDLATFVPISTVAGMPRYLRELFWSIVEHS